MNMKLRFRWQIERRANDTIRTSTQCEIDSKHSICVRVFWTIYSFVWFFFRAKSISNGRNKNRTIKNTIIQVDWLHAKMLIERSLQTNLFKRKWYFFGSKLNPKESSRRRFVSENRNLRVFFLRTAKLFLIKIGFNWRPFDGQMISREIYWFSAPRNQSFEFYFLFFSGFIRRFLEGSQIQQQQIVAAAKLKAQSKKYFFPLLTEATMLRLFVVMSRGN